MQFKEIKFMRQAAHPDVRSCVVVPVICLLTGWQLCFGKSGNQVSVTLESQRGEQRVFKTIDSAVREAKRLGFDRVEVFNPL